MKAIVAVTSNWGIGKDNRLLVSIPEDMKFFRLKTTGAVVIMGRKTLESFPGSRPLADRINIVITRDPAGLSEGAILALSVDEAASKAAAYPDRDVYVIGGESIYRQMVPMCDTVYVTKVGGEPEADAFFPDLDSDPDWQVACESEEKHWEGLNYRFVTYVKK